MVGENWRGETFVSDSEAEQDEIKLIDGDLGSDNIGSFGPRSKREAQAVIDYDEKKYIGPLSIETYCMDDRFTGAGVQLPGNRAITEIAGLYMEPGSEKLTLSEAVEFKVKSLVAMKRIPYFHGDEATGRAGCAANANLRAVLAFNARHVDIVTPRIYLRLRLGGYDQLSPDTIRASILTGGDRAARDDLWNADAEDVVDIATANRAEYISFKGAHHTAGPRENFRRETFNNALFRKNHLTDEGHPLGVLSIDYGGYSEQLERDGYSRDDVSRMMMHAVSFSVGILKFACSDKAISKIVT